MSGRRPSSTFACLNVSLVSHVGMKSPVCVLYGQHAVLGPTVRLQTPCVYALWPSGFGFADL